MLLRDHKKIFRLVCRCFNDLIVGSPIFWSAISLIPFTFRDQKSGMIYHTVRAWRREEVILRLKTLSHRSNTMPLTVIWNTPYLCGPSVLQELIIYFLQLFPFSRWRSLELYDYIIPHPYGAISVQNAMARFITGPTILEYLHISGSASHQNYLLKILADIPHKIARVDVKGDINDSTPGSYAPFICRATSLSITHGEVKMIRFSDSISTLHIRELQGQPYTMPRVTKLTISWCCNLQQLASLDAP